jgi:hypothetical protein
LARGSPRYFLVFLVPKLRLGMPSAKLRFAATIPAGDPYSLEKKSKCRRKITITKRMKSKIKEQD